MDECKLLCKIPTIDLTITIFAKIDFLMHLFQWGNYANASCW
jgi:hypothetical protein